MSDQTSRVDGNFWKMAPATTAWLIQLGVLIWGAATMATSVNQLSRTLDETRLQQQRFEVLVSGRLTDLSIRLAVLEALNGRPLAERRLPQDP